ncbi:hypothetical protein ACOMHN_067159 [Nucella lapillus]
MTASGSWRAANHVILALTDGGKTARKAPRLRNPTTVSAISSRGAPRRAVESTSTRRGLCSKPPTRGRGS